MNDYYARDIGNKIRAGYRQKQREGIVITPPFGYWKDRNTNEIKIQPEAAETVRMVYTLYLVGYGQRRSPASSMGWGERHRRSSVPNAVAGRCGPRTKPGTGNISGLMPASRMYWWRRVTPAYW